MANRRLMHLVVIDSETLEVCRYEAVGSSKPKRTHEGGFIVTGDRARELEVIERFRKFPDPRFGQDGPCGSFDPEEYLWMAPGDPRLLV